MSPQQTITYPIRQEIVAKPQSAGPPIAVMMIDRTGWKLLDNGDYELARDFPMQPSYHESTIGVPAER